MNATKFGEEPDSPASTDGTKPKKLEKPKRTTIGVQFTDEIINGMNEFQIDDDRAFGYLVRVACTEYIAKRRRLKEQLRDV